MKPVHEMLHALDSVEETIRQLQAQMEIEQGKAAHLKRGIAQRLGLLDSIQAEAACATQRRLPPITKEIESLAPGEHLVANADSGTDMARRLAGARFKGIKIVQKKIGPGTFRVERVA